LSVPLRALVLGYRYLISPLLPQTCRFAPTCSAYALEALQQHGAVAGGWLAFQRIACCHPWGRSGYDPVPKPVRTAGRDADARRDTTPDIMIDASHTIGRPQ